MQEARINKTQPGEHSVDLLRLLQVIWKWKYIILALVLLAGISTYIIAQMTVAPVYRSSFTAYVHNRQDASVSSGSTNTSDINASKQLALLYQEIITSRSVLQEAAQKAGLNYSYATLSKMVQTDVAESTAIISVYINAQNSDEAVQFAAAIAEAAPAHVARVVPGSSMSIVDAPVKPRQAYGPDSWRYATNAALIALGTGILIVCLVDMVTDKVTTTKELEERYGLVVMGHIPGFVFEDKYSQGYGATKTGRSRK